MQSFCVAKKQGLPKGQQLQGRRNNRVNVTRENDSDSDTPNVAFVANQGKEAEKKTYWVPDSGASSHMKKTEEGFYNIKACSPQESKII